ncbi:EpsG family protein [Enterobacter asburiae]|uniref:EpsG family protein n=1 Tax=Enterobacter asburiae TaxID=61645 RepID=UPI0028681B94|nr:EpsG family protein [Enterobacter asburiae]
MIYAFLTHRKQALFVATTITFLFVALSYPAGGDWIGYFVNYDCNVNNICEPGFVLFEPGYELIVYTVGILGYQSIIVFIALINILLLYQYAKYFEHGCYIIIAIMSMFLWSVYIEAIRQAIAMSIIMYSINHLICKNTKKYILLVLLASTFHTTAVIALIFLIPIYSRVFTKIIGYGLLISGGLFFFLSTTLLNLALLILPADSIASQKLNFYLNSEQYKPLLSVGSGTLLDILLMVLIAVSFYRIKKNSLSKHDHLNNVMLLGSCLYISFAIFIGKMMPVMTRIGWYGMPFVLIVLYVNIGESFYYKKYTKAVRNSLSKYLIYMFFGLQIIRPFTYEYSNYNILHQQTIFQNIDALDDISLREAARNKCLILTHMGYGYLCSI